MISFVVIYVSQPVIKNGPELICLGHLYNFSLQARQRHAPAVCAE
jgi:hypothetical protein